jgi:hypothetical protein
MAFWPARFFASASAASRSPSRECHLEISAHSSLTPFGSNRRLADGAAALGALFVCAPIGWREASARSASSLAAMRASSALISD